MSNCMRRDCQPSRLKLLQYICNLQIHNMHAVIAEQAQPPLALTAMQINIRAGHCSMKRLSEAITISPLHRSYRASRQSCAGFPFSSLMSPGKCSTQMLSICDVTGPSQSTPAHRGYQRSRQSCSRDPLFNLLAPQAIPVTLGCRQHSPQAILATMEIHQHSS